MPFTFLKNCSIIFSTVTTRPTSKSAPLTPLLRFMSQSTNIPRKQQRVRDHGFDNYMEVHKKLRKILRFQELLLSQHNHTLCITRLDALSRRLGFKQFEAGAFILKFPHIFEIYEHPVQRILYFRLTRKATLQIQQEAQALESQIPDAINRLRKMIMLSNTKRIRLEHIRIARRDFGLPEDFEYSVILKNPQYFRLFDGKDTRNKYIELVDNKENDDPGLRVCAIERLREREYRERGIDAENIRFSFIINFPPGFKIGKYYKIAVWKWQRLPYWSPYDDVSAFDLRSLEAQKRMEKRALAMIHELLSLTVEKKLTLERIAHFRMVMDLPKKLKEFLLQHQGIFYISTRGNHGKLHTVFLREAYRRGELVEPNALYLARRKLDELILTSPRKAKIDRELGSMWRDREDDERRSVRRDYVENSCEGFMVGDQLEDGEKDSKSNSCSALGSDVDDEDRDENDILTSDSEAGDVGSDVVDNDSDYAGSSDEEDDLDVSK